MKKFSGILLVLAGLFLFFLFEWEMIIMSQEEMKRGGSSLVIVLIPSIFFTLLGVGLLTSKRRKALTGWEEKKEAIRELQLSEPE